MILDRTKQLLLFYSNKMENFVTQSLHATCPKIPPNIHVCKCQIQPRQNESLFSFKPKLHHSSSSKGRSQRVYHRCAHKQNMWTEEKFTVHFRKAKTTPFLGLLPCNPTCPKTELEYHVLVYSLVPKERHVQKSSNGCTLGIWIVLKESTVGYTVACLISAPYD